MAAQSDGLILDSLGQQPRIHRLYTQLVFCFAIRTIDEDSLSQVFVRLESALMKLRESFPWVSGNTIEREGIFKIKSCRQNNHILLKDLRTKSRCPDWDAFLAAAFPYKWLDEDTVCPCKTSNDESILHAAGMPVFLVQQNIINGGLLLSFNAQHGAMDMAGMVQVINLFAKACRGVQYDSKESIIGNMDRSKSIPLLEDHGLGTDESNAADADKNKPKTEQQDDAPANHPSLIWAYFGFSARALSHLKAMAMKDVAEGDFVSTDDVLSAFVWQAIARVRVQRKHDNDEDSNTTLLRNVDMRQHFSLPPSYPGLCVTTTRHTEAMASITKKSIGAIASQLRRSLDPAKLKRQTQLKATMTLKSQRDGDGSSNSARKPANEVRLSSWAKENCYDLDFGDTLGKPVAVRRPSFVNGAREGLVYLLPKSHDGEIVVGICLSTDDMKALEADTHMADSSVYIG